MLHPVVEFGDAEYRFLLDLYRQQRFDELSEQLLGAGTVEIIPFCKYADYMALMEGDR